MRYAPLIFLIASSTAQAGLWEWPRQPVYPADYAELRRVATLTSLPRCQLEASAESSRDAFNAAIMPRYHYAGPMTYTAPTTTAPATPAAPTALPALPPTGRVGRFLVR